LKAFFSDLLSWKSWKQSEVDAWNKGYYSCIGDEILPFKGLLAAGAAKLGEEAVTKAAEEKGSWLAGTYYHFTDGRFTAWGRSSKVLVPKAAARIGMVVKGINFAGWALTDIELAHAIHSCSGKL